LATAASSDTSTLPPESSATVAPSEDAATDPTEQRRQRHRAGALDDELRALDEQHHRLGDVVLGHGDEVVEQRVQQWTRQLPRLFDGDAVGDRARPLLDLDADDRHLGPLLLDRQAYPGGQPPAADRHDDARELRDVVQQLEPDTRLARYDVQVVERVHERQALGVGQLARERDAVVHRAALLTDLGPEGADGLDLRHRRVDRHDHAAFEPVRPRGVGQCLRVVAGAARDDATGGTGDRARLVQGAS
jgi:hypothetical protein